MSNHGLFAINTLIDAQSAWEIFFNRFYSAEVPKDANVKFDSNQREFIPRRDKRAKDKQFFWNTDEKMAYYSSTAGEDFHSDDFDDFLNGYTVRIPNDLELNETDFKRVEEAILQGNYKAEIFENENHVFYALWLFKQNKISRQQFSTLLAREQFPKETAIVKTFHILDSKGNFTKEAKKMLVPMLKKNEFTKFTDWHLERFRLLIQAAPKSEQIFYITEGDSNNVLGQGIDRFRNALIRVKCWERTKYKFRLCDLHLSFGAIEARQIALCGVHGAAANRAKIGVISPGEIKKGVINNYRPTAISINNSGVNPTVEDIHNFPPSTMPTVTKHDVYHAQLHNTIPPEFHLAFNHMKQIIFTFTKERSSEFHWILTDREFTSLKDRSIKLDAKKGAKLFTEMFSDKNELRNTLPLLFNDYSFCNLSDEGIAIILDMINDSDKWKKLYKIDINSLGYPYRRAIQQMRAFIKVVKEEPFDAKLFSLKYRIFCDLPTTSYQKISKFIDSLGNNTLANNFSFGKAKYIKNRTVLKLDEEDVFDANSALQAVFYNYLDSKFAINKLQVEHESEQLKTEFKNIREDSQLTKAKIDDVCNKLDSLADKLMLLENCYKKIIKTRYTRRYPLIDSCFKDHFSFMKNPLTMSQRKHIGLLKAKMDNLVDEHLVKITDEQEKEQFKWVLENYFVLMHHKDRRVNSDSISDDKAHSSNVTVAAPTRP